MYYLDIETVSAFKDFESADDRTKELFKTKFFREIHEQMEKGAESDQAAGWLYKDKAAVLAEFNRIVCVSLGTITALGAENKNPFISNRSLAVMRKRYLNNCQAL